MIKYMLGLLKPGRAISMKKILFHILRSLWCRHGPYMGQEAEAVCGTVRKE